jgi:hypothetical protein
MIRKEVTYNKPKGTSWAEVDKSSKLHRQISCGAAGLLLTVYNDNTWAYR